MLKKKQLEKIEEILMSNLEEGYSIHLEEHYSYITPSPTTYPFQYWWDTFFHVFILCRLGKVDVAKRNFRSLFLLQEDSGFVGHMIYWQRLLPKDLSHVIQARPTLNRARPYMSALIQPPFVAQALEKIYQTEKDTKFLKEMYHKVKDYHSWLIENRDFDDDGLINIISPFESGIDWKPSFDEMVGFKGKANKNLLFKMRVVDFKNFIKRYDIDKIREANNFCVKEVGLNTAYALDLEAMSRLAKIVGDKDSDFYSERAEKTTASMLEQMYDEVNKAFFDVQWKTQKKLKVLTPSIFMPVALKGIPVDIGRGIIEAHFHNPEEFKVEFPLPSVSISHPAFSRKHTYYLWRGPTWAFYNWFLYRCFECTAYYHKEANVLYHSLKKLIDKGGFREYYDPFTGKGKGAKDFTWSALIIDMNCD